VFNATHIKLYIKAVIEKKSKACRPKKKTKADAAKKNSKRALLFIYYDEGPPRKRDEHQYSRSGEEKARPLAPPNRIKKRESQSSLSSL